MIHEASITYPESAMMNNMKRKVECQGSEDGSCGWDGGMYLNGDDCCELWVVESKLSVQKEGQRYLYSQLPHHSLPLLRPSSL